EKAPTWEQKESHYENAIKFYRGDFLPDLEDTWVLIERERLRQAYIGVLLIIAAKKQEERIFEDALEYCQQIFREDPCQEDAHRIAMRVYAAMGNRALVIRQYEQCKQALMSEVEALPSFQTQTLYKTLIQ
ncbi:MAG TPA: bacterial transcriptional activator domain-containing protein, partial [Pseudomonadales bacterium]|nr:bacterial transcriptional activator domain-containing protein [Pseudomonadales bacterium]